MKTLIDHIEKIREMKNSEAKRKEFNNKMVKITKHYQKIYKFKTSNKKGNEFWNNEADAFKHAFGSALMVFEMGHIGSFLGGIEHEYKTNNNPQNEWNMDSWNNKVGRNIANEIKKEYGEKNFSNLSQRKQEDIIAHKVMVKMKNGDLITNPNDTRVFKGFFEEKAYLKKQKEDKKSKKPQNPVSTDYKSNASNKKSSIKVDFNNVSINGKQYKDWTTKEQKAFWDGFDSNSLSTNKDTKLKENIIKENKGKTGKIGIAGSSHWITIDHNHVLIED